MSESLAVGRAQTRAAGRAGDTAGVAALAAREYIYLEKRFSDHAPLVIDYDFTL